MHAISDACGFAQKQNTRQAIFNGFSPGALGPPYTSSFMDPPIGLSWSWFMQRLFPFSMLFQPSGNTPKFPSPHLKETLLAPQQGFLGVGSIPYIPLNPPSLPGALA